MHADKPREIIDCGIQKWTTVFDTQVIVWDSFIRRQIIVVVIVVVVFFFLLRVWG